MTMHNPSSKNSHMQEAIMKNKMSNVVNAGIFKKKTAAKLPAAKGPARKEATPPQPKPKAIKFSPAPKTRAVFKSKKGV